MVSKCTKDERNNPQAQNTPTKYSNDLMTSALKLKKWTQNISKNQIKYKTVDNKEKSNA